MKRLFVLLLTVVYFFAIPLTAFCENNGSLRNASGTINRSISVDPNGRIEGFSTELYNNPNGLPTSEANAIAETSEGFIWIGSYAGLIRHDGNSFERIERLNMFIVRE